MQTMMCGKYDLLLTYFNILNWLKNIYIFHTYLSLNENIYIPDEINIFCILSMKFEQESMICYRMSVEDDSQVLPYQISPEYLWNWLNCFCLLSVHWTRMTQNESFRCTSCEYFLGISFKSICWFMKYFANRQKNHT